MTDAENSDTKDVLYQFAVEQEIPDAAQLKRYQKQYPELAAELEQLAVEIVRDAHIHSDLDHGI